MWTREQVLCTVKQCLKDYDIHHLVLIEINNITEFTRFGELGFDSLDCVEFVMAIEEKFGIDITDIEMENCVTFKDLVDLIMRFFDEEGNRKKIVTRFSSITVSPEKLAEFIFELKNDRPWINTDVRDKEIREIEKWLCEKI